MSLKAEKVKKKNPELRFPGFEGEWEEKRLEEVYSFQATNSLSRDKLNYFSGQIKNIHYGDIHTKFRSHFDTTKEVIPFINSDQEPKYSKSDFIECGDLVLADASEDYADIGKGIEVCNVDGQKVVSGLHTLLLKAKSNGVALGFMGHLIKSPNFRLSIKRVAQGTKVLGISKQYIQKLEFQLPQKAEQQKIAAFLTAVDEWIENLKAQKGKWEEYKKGLLQKIFSQEIRFKDEDGNEFPDWEEKRLGEVADVKHGYAFKSESYVDDGEYSIVTISNVQNGRLAMGQTSSINVLPKDMRKHQSLLVGDMLISMTGNVGRVCIVDQEGCLLNQRVGKIVVEKNIANDQFVFQKLNSQKFEYRMRSLAQGGAQGNISNDDIRGFILPLPSMKEQQKIAAILTTVDEMIHSHQERIVRAEEWKKGLMQRMFV